MKQNQKEIIAQRDLIVKLRGTPEMRKVCRNVGMDDPRSKAQLPYHRALKADLLSIDSPREGKFVDVWIDILNLMLDVDSNR